MFKVMFVGIGGFLGACARYLVGLLIQRLFPTLFPWGTAVVNLTGCFLIGFLATFGAEVAPFSSELRLFLITGILGGLTTFSTFGWETVRLFGEGSAVLALTNIALNLGAGLGAVVLGVAAARFL